MRSPGDFRFQPGDLLLTSMLRYGNPVPDLSGCIVSVSDDDGAAGVHLLSMNEVIVGIPSAFLLSTGLFDEYEVRVFRKGRLVCFRSVMHGSNREET